MNEWDGKGGMLRMPETEAAYRAEQAKPGFGERCPLCEDRASVKEFEYWRIVANLYPYDLIARVHDMLVLKRHASDDELTEAEKAELHAVKYGPLQDSYQFMMEPMRKFKSIPAHAHIHLVIAK